MAELDEQTTAPPAPESGAYSAAFAERVAGEKKLDGPEPSDESAPAGSNDTPAEAAASGTDSGEAQAFDPWTGLSPEQRSYFERVRNSEQSQRGRVGALTKKLNGMERAAQVPQETPKAAIEGEEAPASEPDDLDKIAEEYGDVVGPLVREARELRAEVQALKAPAATKAEVDASAEELTEAYRVLERAHPDYAAIGADQSFRDWVARQDENTQALSVSYDPKDVSLLLQLFKAERSAASAMQSGEGGGQQDGTATDARRARQLEGSRAVTSRGAPAAAGVPNDFSSAWKARASQPR